MSAKKTRYVVLTGGVLSGLGKGVFLSSLGFLLKSHGYSVVPIKIDPYLNIDAGTMSPIEHGEVFVLDDGNEVDMDFGTYERFLDQDLKSGSSITTGKIFRSVLEKERRGDYLGKTVQLIPHVTGELQKHYIESGKCNDADFVLIEVGGTVGDIENQIFLESLRELSCKEEVFFIHLVLVPSVPGVGEQKTKPAQQSVRMLREIGITPHMLVCRASDFISQNVRDKIQLFCGVPASNVVSSPDVEHLYELPLLLESQNVARSLLGFFGLPFNEPALREWNSFTDALTIESPRLNIGLMGKYTMLKDSYASIIESLVHAAARVKCEVSIKCIEASDIERGKLAVEDAFRGIDGIIVPGGFGERGIEGKISCIRYAREKGVPFLGLCLGFQLAVVEYARNVAGIEGAHSSEFTKSGHPVIDLMGSQLGLTEKGGSMRLGSYEAALLPGSRVRSLYGADKVKERHRHRYEVNNSYRAQLESGGLVFSGFSPDGKLMEFLELPKHKFFVATQAHPEFLSRPLKPHPLFVGLLGACIGSKTVQAPSISVHPRAGEEIIAS